MLKGLGDIFRSGKKNDFEEYIWSTIKCMVTEENCGYIYINIFPNTFLKGNF